MSDLMGLDAFSPREVAQRVENVGVAKAHLQLVPLALLGVLAGAFIGLGGMLFVLVRSDPTLGYANGQLLGGAVFALGLLMVVVAGAELFTGNNLLVMAWADQKISTRELLRNWAVVALCNLLGAAGMAWLVFASGHLEGNGAAMGQQVVKIALAKQALPWHEALVKGVLCNMLVCLAVWMAMAGRTLVDKAVAVIGPVVAFVAAGFEHSIANMYFLPQAWLWQQAHGLVNDQAAVTWVGMLHNWVPVILGNVAGGSFLVAGVYYLIYRRYPPVA
jgi:formate/nitrite transporter